MLRTPLFRLPELRYERIIWVLFLALVGLILYNAVSHKKSSFADGVQVKVVPLADGEKLITENDVRQALLRSFGNTLEGTELGHLEVERVERVLEEDPFVEDADSYIDQNNFLHVCIQQRAPVLRILDNNGGNYYLDENGVKMPPSRNFTARVIVATGKIPAYTPEFKLKQHSTLQDLLILTETLNKDKFFKDFIQQIHINNAGDFMLAPLVGDQEIILGSIRNLDDKLERLKIFYKEGMPYAGWHLYKSINLKFKGQVVCKK